MVLAGRSAEQLGIIDFKPSHDIFQRINMIRCENKDNLQQVWSRYQQKFRDLNKLKHYQIKLQINKDIKLKVEPQRSVTYHMKERVNKAIKK